MPFTEKTGRGAEGLSPQKLELLQKEAADCTLAGEQFDLQGNPEQAEGQYLQALRISVRLLELTGEPVYADAASENCSSLADLCMQQGNMHGADRYYVLSLHYARRNQEK